MSKELTPLKALKELKKRYGKKFSLNDDGRCRVIEAALKRLEEIDHRDSIIGPIEEVPIDTLSKKLKALEIIKNKRVTIPLLLNTDSVEEYNETIKHSCVKVIYKPLTLTLQEYNLLKEVLL